LASPDLPVGVGGAPRFFWTFSASVSLLAEHPVNPKNKTISNVRPNPRIKTFTRLSPVASLKDE
jgi:hypothetical protein